MDTTTLLFVLLRHAVCGDALPDEMKNACTPETLEELYVLAKKHDLSHLVAHTVEKLDLPECETRSKLKKAKMRAIYRYARLDYDFECICHVLEKAQIAFLPLKGSVLRQYYPEPWMRTSCDIDILVHEHDLDTAAQALIAQDWRKEDKYAYHDLSFYSPSGTHLELHFQLAENMDNIDPVLVRVWEYSSTIEGKQYEYRQNNAFFMFHHIAHMSYHLVAGGCGIRPLLDLWIMNNVMAYDQNAFRSLLTDAKLEVFHESIIELVKACFENQPYTPRAQRLETYILSGGVYGTLSNHVLVSQARVGSSKENLRQRIIQPYDELSAYYPILKKYKYLTPLFQIVRWIRVICNGRWKKSVHELKLNQSNSNEDIQQAKDFLAEIGLSGIERSSQIQK